MPRPVRKPKQLSSLQASIGNATADVGPGCVKAVNPTNPIHANRDSMISQDTASNNQGSNRFGFTRPKGVGKATIPVAIDPDGDGEDKVLSDHNSVDENYEDLYQPSIISISRESNRQNPIDVGCSLISAPQSPPKKEIRRLRTSDLLPLLPARRKRRPIRGRKEMPSVNTSDAESEDDGPVKSKHDKKLRVTDKENDQPKAVVDDINSEKERQIAEQRKTVKARFAEIDKWDLTFETIDLSFSSQ